ncbi:MAG: DUF3592 domain-containing protein, partial [Planctomycetota bacterium]
FLHFLDIFLLPVAVGALLILQGFSTSRLASRAKRWPALAGNVVAARIEVREREERRGKLPVRKKRIKAVEVDYQYQVDTDQRYGSQFIEASSDRSAEAILAAYQSSSGVDVFVDPESPDRSFVELPRPNSGNSLVLCGAGLIAFAGWMAFRSSLFAAT